MSDLTDPIPSDDDYPVEHSSLEREETRDGVSVRICIYRGLEERGWQLEVEDDTGGSTLWDDPFDTDQAALDEALRTIEEEGIESFAMSQSSPSAMHQLWMLDTAEGPVATVKQALDASDEMLGFHAACGLFAAVVTAPELVSPSVWLEHIKGEHVFEGLEELQGFMNGLMELYNRVARSVAEQDAHCVPPPDDHSAIRDFCDGYITLAANDPTWEGHQRAFVQLLPMFALSGATPLDKIGELLPAAKEDPDGWLQNEREDLPATVRALYLFWASARTGEDPIPRPGDPGRREGPKVGRNDPCPCGSGKKFKKCCAN